MNNQAEVISTQTSDMLAAVIENVYREAYLEVSRQMSLPLPQQTRGVLGDPDKFLQLIIPPDDPEAETKRRRQVGLRIKAMRKKIGLTQAEVAKKLGIASQSVTNYESGKTDPSIRNLISLAAVLGVSTDYLLGRSIH